MQQPMKSLWNASGDALIVPRLAIADSFFTKLRGLLGRSEIAEDEALMITGCRQVHMMFMRFPIDVIFLGRSKLIVALEADLKPWRVSRLVPDADCVIEVQAGLIAKHRLTVGDRLEARPNVSPL